MKARTRVFNSSGFTLFELLITIAVVGMIMGIVVGGAGNLLENDMKSAAAKLSSTIRYIYNKSATEGAYLRLVFDFEQQTYWVEGTGDPVKLTSPAEAARLEQKRSKAGVKEEDKKKDQDKEEAKNGNQKEADGNGEVAAEEESIKPKEPTFGQVDSFLLKPVKMPDGVFLKDLYVEHREGAVDGGKEYIYFFPNGYVESAVINLRDEDDEINYSLKTSPVSGRVKIENFYRNLSAE